MKREKRIIHQNQFFEIFEVLLNIFFSGASDAQQFLQKRFLGIPFPREQRREAKESYEER